MAEVKWIDMLGWTPDQLGELRFAGFCFLREGHYQKALTFFKALIILDPTSIYDIQTLGALYLQIGDNQEALYFLDQALSMNPNHEPTLLNKVKALLILGQKREALELAQRLEKSSDIMLANDASALILAYS